MTNLYDSPTSPLEPTKTPLPDRLTKKLIRLVVYGLCWTVAYLGLYYFAMKPELRTPKTEFFYICAIDTVDTTSFKANIPFATLLTDWQANPNHYQLCDKPISQSLEVSRMEFRHEGEYWHLIWHNDSLADPLEYFYQIQNDAGGAQIIPVYERRGDISAKMMSGFLALVLGYMLNRLVWRIYQRKLVKQQINN